MNDFGSVIITYFPTEKEITNIRHIASFSKVVVIDNSPTETNFSALSDKEVYVIKNRKNIGLAAALNIGVKYWGEKGVNQVFLFDQDSSVDGNFFTEMLRFKQLMRAQQVIICAPNFFDRNSKTEARFAIVTKWTWKQTSCFKHDNKDPLFVTFAITSGSLIDYQLYKEIGEFRSDYFIDHIDSEYCLRATMHGKRIAINPKVVLEHSIGNRDFHKIAGITIKPNNHKAFRRYYIARNGVRLTLDYLAAYPAYAALTFARISHEVLSIVLYEQNKTRKLLAIVLGLFHGAIGKMGECSSSYILK